VRDGRPERPARRLVKIDMDPLVVAGRIGELIDAFLGDQNPIGLTNFGADETRQVVQHYFPGG
jgi:hypothetical protein